MEVDNSREARRKRNKCLNEVLKDVNEYFNEVIDVDETKFSDISVSLVSSTIIIDDVIYKGDERKSIKKSEYDGLMKVTLKTTTKMLIDGIDDTIKHWSSLNGETEMFEVIPVLCNISDDGEKEVFVPILITIFGDDAWVEYDMFLPTILTVTLVTLVMSRIYSPISVSYTQFTVHNVFSYAYNDYLTDYKDVVGENTRFGKIYPCPEEFKHFL